MTSRLIKLVLILILLLSQIITYSMAQSKQQQKIVLDNDATSHQPHINLDHSSAQQLRFSIRIPSIYTTKVYQNQQTYNKITVEGFSEISEPGKPALPVLGQFLAVPQNADVDVKIINTTYKEIEQIFVPPAQEPLPEENKKDRPQFVIDKAIYQADQFYPVAIGWTEPIKIIRRRPVTILWLAPIQFNPVQKKIRIYTEFIVEVNFRGSSSHSIDCDYQSDNFTNIINRLVVNSNFISSNKSNTKIKSIQKIDNNYKPGCDYLIITHQEFAEAADSLALWKRFGGLETKIVFVDEIGNSAQDLRNYIQHAYDNWRPVPAYVLLLGDAEFVPTNYFTNHPEEDNGMIGTDLYYATVDGTDYFPDLITGRIPVDSGIEALSFINKVIDYERNPISNPEFYGNAVVTAYFQDDDDADTPDYNERDGYEDRRFILTSEEIRDFLTSHGYTTERIYYAESSVTPTNYNNTFYAGGEPIPAELLRARGFQWDGDANDIKTVIERGCFIVSHRDHGSRNGWGNPQYRSGNVISLKNGQRLPVIFSINCNTGWFDNETDDDVTGTNFNSECFVEYWLRNFEGGAIGVFGSSRVSYSGYNDALAKGFFDAIWPQFSLYHPSGAEDKPIYNLGGVLNYGKLYLAANYTNISRRKVEFEEFHYYGDPVTSIWTEFPGTLIVASVDSCFLNQTELAFQVSYKDAIITLLQNNEIIVTSSSNASGTTTLQFPPLSSKKPLQLCVKKENFKPYIATIRVVPFEGFAIVCESKQIIDEDQNNEINIGETITWKLGIRNAGNLKAANIQFEIVSSDTFIEYLNDTALIDNIGVAEKITLSDLSFKVDKKTPPGHAVEMDLIIRVLPDYQISIPLNFAVLQGKPSIHVSPGFIAARLNDLNDSLAVSLKISNLGFGDLDFYLRDKAREIIPVGDLGQKWLESIPEGAGNIYFFKRQILLSRFGCYMQINSPITIYFSVFEGNELTGMYYKIGETSEYLEQIREGLIKSGGLNFSLLPDKYYYLGVSWTGGDAKISRATDVPPYDISIGEVVTGCINLQGNPPADSIMQKFTRLITFGQELHIGEGDWLTGVPVSDSLLPTEQTQIKLKMFATDEDTTLFTNILIASNDMQQDTVLVPTYLTVGGAHVNLVCQPGEIDDQYGNNNHEINSGETIILPVTLKNIGIGNATNVLAQLTLTDPDIVILDSLELINTIESEQQLSISAFEFEVSPYVIGDHTVPFEIKVTADNNYQQEYKFNFNVTEGDPVVEVEPDSLVGTIAQLNDSLIAEFTITNNGQGRLIYNIENPIQQNISIGTPADNFWLPLNEGIGNIYFPVQPAHVLAMQCYFQVDSVSTIYFFIYEGDSLTGQYHIIAKSKISIEEPGLGWYQSELMECDLSANKYYYIGASWIGTTKIIRVKETIPFISWKGKILNGAFNIGGTPPADIVEIENIAPLCIAQKIITGEDWWLDFQSTPDTLYPNETETTPVTFYPTAVETRFETNIRITSNDPQNKVFQLPTSLTVTAIATNISKIVKLIPRSIVLEQNYPNPFNPSTNFRYGISKPSHVELSIYNIMGQKVRTLVSETQQPGFYQQQWNGEDDFANLISSGIYFIILKAEGKTISQKVLLLK